MKWSISAHNMMRRCQRQFVFSQIVASHSSHDPLRREAYVLRQLQHVTSWQGSLIHFILAGDFLAEALSGRAPEPGRLAKKAVDLARVQLHYSESKEYRTPHESKNHAGENYCALFEHEYERALPSDLLSDVANRASLCFDNLFQPKEFLALVRAGTGHFAEPRLHFRIDDATILAIPDLVFVMSDGQPAIVDWKIALSETSDYSQQVLTYALAVMRSGQWPQAVPSGLKLLEVNLLKNQVITHPVTKDRLEDAEDFVYKSSVEMQTLISGANGDSVDLGEFSMARNPKTCEHCSFARPCSQGSATNTPLKEAAVAQGRLL